MTVILLLICQKMHARPHSHIRPHTHTHTHIYRNKHSLKTHTHSEKHSHFPMPRSERIWVFFISISWKNAMCLHVLSFFLSLFLCHFPGHSLLDHAGKQDFYCTGRALSVTHEGRLEVEFPLEFRPKKHKLTTSPKTCTHTHPHAYTLDKEKKRTPI